MTTNKGFTNRAKSGAKALADRWRQAAAKARIERQRPAHKPARSREKPQH